MDQDIDQTQTTTEESVIVTLPEAVEMDNEYFLKTLGASGVATVAEGAGRAKVNIPVKIIGPGWGARGYYSEDFLKKSAEHLKAGTHMYWNHSTPTEESERPERNLNDLAAVFAKDAYWDANGAKGPGLYTEAKVFSDYSDKVLDKGPHIGVSILAAIKGKTGEAEGRTGRIAEEWIHTFSTDFVTKAGAKGAPIVAESAGTIPPPKEKTSMTDQEVAALQTENTRLKESMAAMQRSQDTVVATATVGAILREAEIPFSQPLLELACANPVIKEGRVDQDWAKNTAGLFGAQFGQVSGHGTTPIRESAKDTTKTVEARLRESLAGLGVPEAGLDFAVKGGRF